MLYPFFLVIIIITTILILSLKINTKFECIKKKDSSDILIFIHIFSGIIKRKFKIPINNLLSIILTIHNITLNYILFDNKKKYSDLYYKEKESKEIKKLIKYVKLYSRSIQKYLLLKRIPLAKIKIKVVYGSDDAFWTGIIGGAIYSITGSINSIFSSKFRVIEKNVTIQPVFTENVLEIEGLCILSIRLVHIIKAGLFSPIKLINVKFKNKIRR